MLLFFVSLATCATKIQVTPFVNKVVEARVSLWQKMVNGVIRIMARRIGVTVSTVLVGHLLECWKDVKVDPKPFVGFPLEAIIWLLKLFYCIFLAPYFGKRS